MKFILAEKQETKPSLKDVETNQFFVTVDGELCQKISCSSYNMVALKGGIPYADYFSDCHDFVIERVLPKVVKIEF